MTKLLSGNVFDDFCLLKATVVTGNTFDIDGRINKEFYEDEAGAVKGTFSDFKELKPLLFDLIRGKHTPLSLHFILGLKNETVAGHFGISGEEAFSLSSSASFIATIHYAGGIARVVSGVSHQTFSTDKTPDELWDKALEHLLSKHAISYDVT